MTLPLRFIRLAIVGGIALSTCAPLAVHAQAYPSRPISIIVPSPPGGPSDIMSRLIAAKLTTRLGQPVVVENRPGVAGFVGVQAVARAAPDGYTLGLNSMVYQILNQEFYKGKLPYDPERDFRQIALLAHVPYILVSSPSFPASDLKSLIALSKSSPGKFNYGIPGGAGNTSHIASEYLKKIAGIDVMPIPYQGDGPSLTALMAGDIQWQFTTPVGAMPHVRSGRIKLLAIATPKRLENLPDTPTFVESGFPDFVISTWFGFQAPVGIPDDIARKLNSEINAVLKMPDIQARFADLGAIPAGGSLEEVAAFIKDQTPKWKRMVRESGAKIE
jgi:tripartite-type tricarboxylate transporter receptor subunit TctC